MGDENTGGKGSGNGDQRFGGNVCLAGEFDLFADLPDVPAGIVGVLSEILFQGINGQSKPVAALGKFYTGFFTGGFVQFSAPN
ncbi:MAG: hypothetical protein LLF76_02505 [Planctomycetaceae bacterium]|nr:hypothetical protein [Planctomycetaceae bacterium]